MVSIMLGRHYIVRIRICYSVGNDSLVWSWMILADIVSLELMVSPYFLILMSVS
ncbi:hypothetical protein KSS87_007597 [Heliosperma pusillum]|nr:hypothetical protein KSS87_007597 [Heliosperma pusillum]